MQGRVMALAEVRRNAQVMDELQAYATGLQSQTEFADIENR